MDNQGPRRTNEKPGCGHTDVERGSRSSVRKRHTSLLTDEQYQNTMATMHALQMKVFNFLERPTGWKCFVYHFIV